MALIQLVEERLNGQSHNDVTPDILSAVQEEILHVHRLALSETEKTARMARLLEIACVALKTPTDEAALKDAIRFLTDLHNA